MHATALDVAYNVCDALQKLLASQIEREEGERRREEGDVRRGEGDTSVETGRDAGT